VDPAQFPESVLVVRRVVISVGDVDLFVPRSIYADLLWVHEGRLRQQGKVLQLILLGGDGAESYRVVVEFDKKGVRKRTLFGGESQKPTQETIYYKVVIG